MTRNPVRVEVSPPPRAERHDVEMGDIEEAKSGGNAVASGSGSTSETKTPITLPRYLARPNFKEVSRENITAIDPELADVPLDYIQEGLEITGPE